MLILSLNYFMTTSFENVRQQVFNTFNLADKNNYWKTMSEIAEDANVELRDVIKLVFNEPEIAMSTYRQKDGEPVFTTRDAFHKHAPFFVKFRGDRKSVV